MRIGLALMLVAMLGGVPFSAAQLPAPMTGRAAIDVAKALAERYPGQPSMSYIAALAWSGQLRLSSLTGDPQWRARALQAIQPLVSDQTPAIAPPYRLTSLAGALALADAGSFAGDRAAAAQAAKVAAFILPDAPETHVKFATGWTDDMFMASAVLSRAGSDNGATVLRKLLKVYAEKLQRPDGLFVHAPDAPHTWGRGNGFALLGVAEALTHLPETWPPMPERWATRPHLLDVYRRHIAALANHQSDDGSWRQVVDEPTSYRELTVTAMTVAALARGVSRGWIDRAKYEPVLMRGWQAVATRVYSDGTVRDVCSGTAAGATRGYYLNRPVVDGADDRGGAMALLAAIEMIEFERRR